MARKPIEILRIAVIAVALVAALAPAASSAHTGPHGEIRAAAAKTAREIKVLTGAYESRVVGCTRKTPHSSLCRVRARYSDGLQTCITDVPVRYSGHADRAPRGEIADTICF